MVESKHTTDVPLGRLGPVSGRANRVSVTLTGLSFRQAGHARRYPYDDFGPDFIAALHDGLTPPHRGGILRSKLACPWCDAPVDGDAVGQISVAIDVALARIAPVRVELEMPGIRCPRCDRPLVMIDDRSIDSDVSDALIAAFAAGEFGPG